MTKKQQGPSETTSGRVKTSITLPRELWQRIRRAAAYEKRTVSGEIEFAVERHVEVIEKNLGLTAKIEE
jgi:predicted DNA-binding protein